MLSKKVSKPMTDAELEAWEATRDLEAELVESVRQMAQGKTAVAYSPVIAARKGSGLSQSQFASLLGVSVRTLQGWEQGRRQPTGAARALIAIAQKNPQSLPIWPVMRDLPWLLRALESCSLHSAALLPCWHLRPLRAP